MIEEIRGQIAIKAGTLCNFGGCDAMCEECKGALEVAGQILALFPKGYEEGLLTDEELKRILADEKLLIKGADIPLLYRPYIKITKEAQQALTIRLENEKHQEEIAGIFEIAIYQILGLNTYQATKEDTAWNRAIGEAIKILKALKEKTEEKWK